MKISKLFHWLYAFLMFLPIVMFVPSCLYYSLNKYATNETTTEIIYKYQSNEVNTLDDLVEGNLYTCNYLNLVLSDIEEDFDISIYSYDETSTIEWFNYSGLDEVASNEQYNNKNGNKVKLHFTSGNELYVYFTNNTLYASVVYTEFAYQFKNVVFSIDYNLEYFSTYLIPSGSSLPQYTDYNVIESVETNIQDTISNKMYLAWESIWNLPLFVWTKNSFVSAPFTYITGLFGLSSTNSLNYVFTYFVSISICWLVFDLIMYVPNLAHKWIDKGAIE